MRCEEAAEFVSALCDGELIPIDAAQHIETCVECGVRLRDYLETGAELRLVASAELSVVAQVRVWERKQGGITNLWMKGWETMRVPRFAFGLLLAEVVVLGSSLIATRARAHGEGPVVMLSIAPNGGKASLCAMPTIGKLDYTCGLMGRTKSGDLSYKIRIVAKEGDKVELGIRAKFNESSGDGGHLFQFGDMASLPEKNYWFSPGEKLDVPVAGTGPIEVSGEWMDHMPPSPSTPNMDPKVDELRITSPMILRDKSVVIDMEGGSSSANGIDNGVDIYKRGEGRYRFALSSFKGATQGKISKNRLTFEIDGHAYELIAGAPIARSYQAWVRRDADFVPPGSGGVLGYIGGFGLSDAANSR